MPALLSLLLTLLAPSAFSECENYCLGIRGNGEQQPVHPTIIAHMTEDFGMPKAITGGSSAAVTQFLTAQVRANAKAAQEKDPERQRKLQALLLKSMPEFEAALAADAKVSDAFALAQVFSAPDKDKLQAIAQILHGATTGAYSRPQLHAALSKYGMLLNPELVRLVEKDPQRFGPEAEKSVVNLGKFNAVTDDTLLFRPGLVDFKGVAMVLGYMGDFYAGNVDPATRQRLDKYLDRCAEPSFHKEWMAAPADCRDEFHAIAADYLAAGKFQNKALFEKVDQHGSFMPSTSVLQGNGMTQYLGMKQAYQNGKAKNIEDFSVDFSHDVGFGYWGNNRELAAVNHNLEKFREQGDLKAKHFRDLGPANWFEVLSTSPAEPGIANAQPVPFNTTAAQVKRELAKPFDKRWSGLKYRRDVLSIGGWSDLQPTEVLRSNPACDHVIYVTRHATYGDSKFAQQLLVRLAGDKKNVPFWDKIDQGGASGWCDEAIKAQHADPEKVRKSAWGQLLNLCNPESSFRRSLDVADGSYCTNWDDASLDVFSGKMREAVKDAYESPLIPISAKGASCALNKQPANLDARALPGCLPYPKQVPGGSQAPAAGGESGASRGAE